MSLQSTILKLNSPIKELLLSVTRDGKELGGETEADAKEIIGWVGKASQADFVAENNIKVCFTRISDEIFCSIYSRTSTLLSSQKRMLPQII